MLIYFILLIELRLKFCFSMKKGISSRDSNLARMEHCLDVCPTTAVDASSTSWTEHSTDCVWHRNWGKWSVVTHSLAINSKRSAVESVEMTGGSVTFTFCQSIRSM